jgi:NAD(P)-dependent dehydrogenase (short-subunit alcohol dehydrogenase family)
VSVGGDRTRVAWITGAGKGIGRALAKRLAEADWTIAASARTREDLASLEAQCPQGRVHGFVLDITDVPSTQAASLS